MLGHLWLRQSHADTIIEQLRPDMFTLEHGPELFRVLEILRRDNGREIARRSPTAFRLLRSDIEDAMKARQFRLGGSMELLMVCTKMANSALEPIREHVDRVVGAHDTRVLRNAMANLARKRRAVSDGGP
ncbi:MAG: hypothetical protein IH969_10620 [Candidatus Krumholzibacteriota bacterium]|nr:hypothetical protein [Candidatus Krumholzibacteriota bacterium]